MWSGSRRAAGWNPSTGWRSRATASTPTRPAGWAWTRAGGCTRSGAAAPGPRVARAGPGGTVLAGPRLAVEQGAPPPDYPAGVAAVGRAVGDLAGAVAPAVPAGRGRADVPGRARPRPPGG